MTSWSTAIFIFGNGNSVKSNDIGFWPGNPSHLPNGYGIYMVGTNNHIGGTSVGDRNVISGNSYDGIELDGTYIPVSGNVIQGNYIGTNAAGAGALANGICGILVYAAQNTIIGGTSTAARNIISGNYSAGVCAGSSTGTVIQGNFIGTNAAGTVALGNGTGYYGGIWLGMGAAQSQIGGTAAGAGNKIAFNRGNGITIEGYVTSVRNAIHQNSIYQNTSLGIDLWNDGVTVNDTLDPDSGPNGLQNYPVITSAHSSTRNITGSLNSTPGQNFVIEFFASVGCDPSHHGEGEIYLGSTNVATNATTGNASFNIVVPASFVIGSDITATATDLSVIPPSSAPAM